MSSKSKPKENQPEGYYCFGWYPEHPACGYVEVSQFAEHKRKFKKAKIEALYHTEIFLAGLRA